MKTVRFTRDMRPYHKGDTLAIDDDAMADRLIAAGDALAAPSVLDTPAAPAATPLARAKAYVTRKRG